MFGIPWPRLKPLGPFQLCGIMPLGLVRRLATLRLQVNRPLGLNPDRVARYGLPRSTIDTWLDYPCVSAICELLVTK